MDILKKQKLTNILIIVLVVINIASLSFIWFRELNHPQLPPPPASPNRENVNRFLDRELDLNAVQEKKFGEIRKEHFEATRLFENKISGFKKQLLSESFNQSPDMQKISVLTDSIGSAQKSYEMFLSGHFQKLAAICTPDQRVKLKIIFLSSFGPKEVPPVPPPGRIMPPGHPPRPEH
jgi:hypothetical protein